MKSKMILLLLSAILIGSVFIISEATRNKEKSYIVGYKEEAAYNEIEDIILHKGGIITHHLESINAFKVKLTEDEAQELLLIKNIGYVELNVKAKISK